MIAHAGGAEGTFAELMIFVGMGLGVAALLRFKRSRREERVGAGLSAVLAVLCVAVLAGAFVLPHRLFGPSAVRPATAGRIEIVTPAPGQVVTEKDLKVEIRPEGIRILDRATTRISSSEGHIHVSIDGTLIAMASGNRQSLDLTGLKPGAHELEAELVAGDHGPFAPRVIAKVLFVYRP